MISQPSCEALWLSLAAIVDEALESSAGSESVTRQTAALLQQIHRAFQEQGSTSISLEMRASLFVYDGVPLSSASIRGRFTIAFLRNIRAGGVEFTHIVTQHDLRLFVKMAVQCVRSGSTGHRLTREEVNQSLEGIHLPESMDAVTWDWIDAGPAGNAYAAAGFELDKADPIRRDTAEAVESAMESAGNGHAVKLEVARTVSEQVVENTKKGFADLMHLAERPEFDVFTVQHSLRVSYLTSYVANMMGAPREVIVELGAAAMFHDVGKGRIPESILYKRGRLDDDEREIMQSHPQLGADILINSADVSTAALGAAWGHHHRYDGQGYPTRRPWFETTKATSLIQICDVFEALTARRPYKAPYSPSRAYSILYSDQGAFDPGVLAAFTRAMGLFPPGRFVLLSDGRLARVAQVTSVIDRPIVRTLPDGEMMDLTAPALAALRVVRLLDEPEFVELLTSGVEGDERVGLAKEHAAAAQAAEADARDEELAFLEIDGAVAVAGDSGTDCGHDGDCRMC